MIVLSVTFLALTLYKMPTARYAANSVFLVQIPCFVPIFLYVLQRGDRPWLSGLPTNPRFNRETRWVARWTTMPHQLATTPGLIQQQVTWCIVGPSWPSVRALIGPVSKLMMTMRWRAAVSATALTGCWCWSVTWPLAWQPFALPWSCMSTDPSRLVAALHTTAQRQTVESCYYYSRIDEF